MTGFKLIRTKFASKCHDTGLSIPKGTEVLYDYDLKQCYAIASPTAQQYIQTKFGGRDEEARVIRVYR